MTQQYSQSISVAVSSTARFKQIAGITFSLASLGFIMLSAFVNWLYMIGFGVFLVIGIVFIQLFNVTPKSYIYDFSIERLVVAKTSVIERTTRLVMMMFCDVKSFSLMSRMLEDGDILACESAHAQGVYEIIYCDSDGTEKRLLFTPDEYMIALIEEILAQKAKQRV